MKNPNEPEVLFLYDWVCERANVIREELMRMVKRFIFYNKSKVYSTFMSVFTNVDQI